MESQYIAKILMAGSGASPSLTVTLGTTLLLIDQFSASLSAPASQTQPQTAQSPLPLLKASATSLKHNVTRLSLLTITPPFSPSAIAPLLNVLNTSILPSLVTATHWTTSEAFTGAFSVEAASLTKQCLSDLKALIQLVYAHATSSVNAMSTASKNVITQATGQVWARLDASLSFVNGGLAGFMTEKVSEWLELMRDAVKELEEWDPEEEVGEDPFGLDDANEDDEPSEEEVDGDRAILQAGVKSEAMKVLIRIPQSIHVVVKQRLGPKHIPEPGSLSRAQKSTLDSVVWKTRKISESIDESAEAMYMGDLERCLKMAGEARNLTIDVVESVQDPWMLGPESKEDVYIRRALEWIRQVQPEPDESKQGVKGIIDATKATNLG